LIININILKSDLKEPMSRVIYELEMNEIRYHFKKNEDDSEGVCFLGKLLRIGKFPSFNIPQQSLFISKM